MWVDLRDSRRWTFHWRKHYYGLWTHILVKNVLMMDLFFTNTAFGFIKCYLMDWSGVDYCDVFISCLDSHSDGTHSLQRIHWWASDGMPHFSKSDDKTNSSTSLMARVWVHFQESYIFGWISLLSLMLFAVWKHYIHNEISNAYFMFLHRNQPKAL